MTTAYARHPANKEILIEMNSGLEDNGRPREKAIDTSVVIKQINGAIFEVSKESGGGFRETVCQNSLVRELEKKNCTQEAMSR
jgi:hypothetical protein